jgi:hypothetical protein
MIQIYACLLMLLFSMSSPRLFLDRLLTSAELVA